MVSLPPLSTDFVRHALAMIVVFREALEDGDTDYAYAVATNLEHDLAGSLQWLDVRDAA